MFNIDSFKLSGSEIHITPSMNDQTTLEWIKKKKTSNTNWFYLYLKTFCQSLEEQNNRISTTNDSELLRTCATDVAFYKNKWLHIALQINR